MRVRVLLLPVALVVATAGCAAVSGRMAGACLEIAARIACATICDDDDDDEPPPEDDVEEDAPRQEEPPPEWQPAFASCEVTEGELISVACSDGTRALFHRGAPEVSAAPADDGPTVRGPVEIRAPADVGRLAGKRAIDGSLILSSAELVRLEVPQLQSVGGDLIAVRAASLEVFALPALAHVGGAVVLSDNPRLPQRAAEELVFALTRHGYKGTVDVAGNAP